jgi:ADP-dependent NAD(P)H-hydrate dehydratase / NAD(P)H-hydrate epimerase
MLLLTAEEMRALDRRTIESGHATGEALMELAGAGVADAIERRFGSALALRVIVLCGAGNNGGDGFVAARHLRARGADVHVGLLGERARVRGDAQIHLERMESAGLTLAEVRSDAELGALTARRDAWDFAIDALLGTGARGAPEGLIAAGVRQLNAVHDLGTRLVAVDLPTGVDADSGTAARDAVRADLTVTFGAPKRGHVLYPGRSHAGAIEVVDIGLIEPSASERAQSVELAAGAEMAPLLPRRDPRAHKGSVGRVLVIGGSTGLTGAVVLAARAATRAGAGYVQVAVPGGSNLVFEIQLTEEMSIPLGGEDRDTLEPADWGELTPFVERAHVVALGSGLSRHSAARDLARRVVRESPRPLVIDADALNAFEDAEDDLARGRSPRVLTPHLGEMSRLTGLEPADIEARRIDVAREYARAWESIVVLKGAPTVTASPDGHVTVNSTGNPGMATAGMGDVLTGTVAALAATEGSLYDRARLAVYLHGLAGDLVAEAHGAIGTRAGDVVEKLPEAIRLLSGLDLAPAARGRS